MRLSSLLRLFAYAGFATATLGAQQPAAAPQPPTPLITQRVDDTLRVMLRGNVHPLARAEFDQGAAPADLRMDRMLLVLKRGPQQEAALKELLEEQQDKTSPAYHQWLTPEQFGQRFGTAPGDIGAVTQWLGAHGLQVTRVSKSGLYVEFSGTAAQVGEAFGTSIHRYAVNGEQHWANASDPTLPAALAAAVSGVDSLHNFEKPAQHVSLGSYIPAERRLAQASPRFTSGSGTSGEYAVTPYDFATIYDLLPLWSATPTAINGAGQTIAIVGRSDINPADARAMWSYFGLDGTHAPQPTLTVTYDGPNPGKTADESEADIDTQWSGAVAPGATINLVVSGSTTSTDGIDLSALYIVDNNLAGILNESYGQCEKSMGSAGAQFYGSLWEQAAAQGISVFVSSGDSGAAGCDNPAKPAQSGVQVNGIASTPYNAAIGGTDFNQLNTWSSYWSSTNNSITKESAVGYIPETSWNDSCTNAVLTQVGWSSNAESNCNNSSLAGLLDSFGGGGGQSSTWLKPVWQTGTPSDNARDLPDASLFASNGFLNSFYLACQSDVPGTNCQYGEMEAFGGTSVSSTAFAGIMALVDQKTGSTQGVPGLTLYKLASLHPSVFHDVPAGSTIAMPCVTGSSNCTTSRGGDAYGVLNGYSTGAGYDLATGLGSVDGAALVNQWASTSFTASTTTLTLNGGAPVSITHGAALPFSVSVSPSAATGDVALMVAPGTPGDPGIANFHLSSGAVSGSTTLLPGGGYSLLAHYGGDSTYGGSYSNSVPVTVSAEPSKVLVTLVTINNNGVRTYAASGATYGSGYAILRVDVGDVTATMSPSGISSLCASHQESCPTGTITLSAPGTSLNSTTLSLNSEGSAEVVVPSAGTYTVSAAYGGDASFGAGSGTASFTVAKASTTPVVSMNTPVQYSSSIGVTTTLQTTSQGVAPTGTVQYYIDGSAMPGSSFVTSSNGYHVSNGTIYYANTVLQGYVNGIATVGTHTAYVQYSGDTNYAPGTSATINFTVAKATPYVVVNGFTTSSGHLLVGQSATGTVEVEGAGGTAAPTGTVTFYDGGVAIPGTVTYTTSLSFLYASISASFSTPGTHVITAGYSGDTNYSAVTSGGVQYLSVLGPVSVTPAASVIIPAPGQTATTTLAVTSNGGFTGNASLTCTPDPKASESTCSFTNGSASASSMQVNVGASGLNLTFTVTTTAPHTLAKENAPHLGPGAGVVLAGLFALLLPRRRQYRSLGLCVLGAMLVLGLGACSGGGGGGASGGGGGGGGSNTDPGTPAGNYSFTVTAVTGSGSSAITLTTPVQVIVY